MNAVTVDSVRAATNNTAQTMVEHLSFPFIGIFRNPIAQAKNMFSAESLRSRLKIELGEDYNKPIEFSPMLSNFSVTEQILPLGVLNFMLLQLLPFLERIHAQWQWRLYQ